MGRRLRSPPLAGNDRQDGDLLQCGFLSVCSIWSPRWTSSRQSGGTLVMASLSNGWVFLYVALVSMMTELQGKNLHSILLNTAGMLGGAVLLLAIGLYEHNLILLFEPDPQPHQH